MKAKITWLNGRVFVGESGSGHSVIMDGEPESGGRNTGFRPMEMMLLGLGGCIIFSPYWRHFNNTSCCQELSVVA